jgi:hypothetical protein
MRKGPRHIRTVFAYAEPILRKYGISSREYQRVDFESAYKEAYAELEIAEKEFWDRLDSKPQPPLSDPSGTIKS